MKELEKRNPELGITLAPWWVILRETNRVGAEYEIVVVVVIVLVAGNVNFLGSIQVQGPICHDLAGHAPLSERMPVGPHSPRNLGGHLIASICLGKEDGEI